MADNNNVFILFEKIKTALNGIKSKAEELLNVVSQQHRIGNDKQDLSLIKEVVMETTNTQSEKIKGLLARQWKVYVQLSPCPCNNLMLSRNCRMSKGDNINSNTCRFTRRWFDF